MGNGREWVMGNRGTASGSDDTCDSCDSYESDDTQRRRTAIGYVNR
jgi:hypothetical protein